MDRGASLYTGGCTVSKIYGGLLVEIITRFYVANTDGEPPDLITLYSHPVERDATADQARLTHVAGPIYAEHDDWENHQRVFDSLPEVQRIEVTKRNGDGIRIYRKPS